MKNVVVVGSQWGDEGKGKIVDWLSSEADIVVRFQGGHLETNKIHNVLLGRNKIKIFNSKKIYTKNTHGTGCTLASAITTFYSCGKTLNKSCELAINYVNHAIRTGPNFGKGNGPINHLVYNK